MLPFFQWLEKSWQFICGLCTALYLVYIVGKFLTNIVLKVASVVERFEAAESTLISVATNHLPHMQWELEKTNKTLISMDETLKKIYANDTGDHE